MRVTELSKLMKLTTTEISRHVNRLGEIGFLQKNPDGFYDITYFGVFILLLLEEFEFASKNITYFEKHDVTQLPLRFIKRIGELSESSYINDVIRFLHHVDDIIDVSEKYVWLKVFQYPLTALNSIVESLNRGTSIKVIEKKEPGSGPHIDLGFSQEMSVEKRAKLSPLVSNKVLDNIYVFLVITEKGYAVSLPNQDGEFDYRGFVGTDERGLSWCRELFEYYWNKSEDRILSLLIESTPRKIDVMSSMKDGRIVVEGRNDSEIDSQAIQDAVDNHPEVILRGTFNLGTSKNETYCGKAEDPPARHKTKAAIIIRKSVKITGEGRVDGVPSTRLFKEGWTYPTFDANDCVFFIDGDDIDVTIENVHISDFNITAIIGEQGHSLKIMNNRITLETGIGRGFRWEHFGDIVTGIRSSGHFPGGIIIEGNLLDFATSFSFNQYQDRRDQPNEPSYRPDVSDYGNYRGHGIHVDLCVGEAIVRDNVIKNMNSRGVLVCDNYETARVYVKENVIESDIFGVYPYFTMYAGMGVLAQGSHLHRMQGFYVEIDDNSVRFSKVNYCGISVQGGVHEDTGKLVGGSIKGNEIHLDNGSVGVLLDACEDFDVSDNRLSGEAYYGVQVTGGERVTGLDFGSYENRVQGNDFRDLVIKDPDDYSIVHVDGKTFSGSEGRSTSAHVWLNKFSARTSVQVKADERVIDEGKDNIISYQENT